MRFDAYIMKQFDVLKNIRTSDEDAYKALERLLKRVEESPKGQTALDMVRDKLLRRAFYPNVGRPVGSGLKEKTEVKKKAAAGVKKVAKATKAKSPKVEKAIETETMADAA